MRDNRGDVLVGAWPQLGETCSQVGVSTRRQSTHNAGTIGNNIESSLSGQGTLQIEVFVCFMSDDVNLSCGASRAIRDAIFSAPINSPIHVSAFRRLTALKFDRSPMKKKKYDFASKQGLLWVNRLKFAVRDLQSPSKFCILYIGHGDSIESKSPNKYDRIRR